MQTEAQIYFFTLKYFAYFCFLLYSNDNKLTFQDFNFTERLEEALSFMNYKEPTPIQQQAIPLVLDNKDLIACAQTGTGKTAAFLLPILHKIATESSLHHTSSVNTLVLVPTRELALQIDQQVEGFAYFLSISSLPVYGGGDSGSWDQQKKALTKGADLIIATPGRLLSHISLGYVNLKAVRHLILDEADRMLDMGFHEDIMQIVKQLPAQRQTLMFSATMPDKIRSLAKTLLNKPEQINIALSKPAEGVIQTAYLAYEPQKIPLLVQILDEKKDFQSIIIFSSTKKMVKIIEMELRRRRFRAQMVSSDLEQAEREQAVQDFRSRKTQILVATDVLSRGIDIKDIDLVINFDVPGDAEDYVHRVGRTARAATTGVAITLISERDVPRFMQIEELIGQTVPKSPLPEWLGEGPRYSTARQSNGGARPPAPRSGNGGGGDRKKPFRHDGDKRRFSERK